jgi:hypothetical protein
MKDLSEVEIAAIKQCALSYFPDCHFTDDNSSLETKDRNEILFQQKKFLSYLQTIFFEEHLIEVQLDQATRIFFAYIVDDLPDPDDEEIEGDTIIEKTVYELGSYLKTAESFLITPVTPGIGNPLIRNSKKIVIRYFSGTTAIELGCTFRMQDTVQDAPVLRISFPIIGRINRNFRSFRVKALPSVEAKVCVTSNSSAIPATFYQIVDVSAEGLAFEVPVDCNFFEVGRVVNLSVMVEGHDTQHVCGNIRNITKVRHSKGYKNICGVQFDLETRALAADLEKLAAAIQRLHLRELAEKTADMDGVDLIR